MIRRILPYNKNLKQTARHLRKNMTDSERVLWSRLRRRQLLGVQFYRQKTIGNYIIVFFAPKTKLVVEVDGSQHLEEDHNKKDNRRDAYLAGLGIRVLRFNSRDVLKHTEMVVEVIFRTIAERLKKEIPLNPPLQKGDLELNPPLQKGDFELNQSLQKRGFE